MEEAHSEAVDIRWKGLCRVGGTAALAAVVVVMIETLVIILTGKLSSSYDASEWFAIFQMAVAVLMISCAMLRDRSFSKACGYVGILASSLILANGLSLAFVPVDLGWTSTILAGSGGLLSFAWWVLVGLRLIALGRLHTGQKLAR